MSKIDLSRIKSSELFEFIKEIKDKENGKATDDALKLIVKISEGSVRDALSLLDRGLLSLEKNKELDTLFTQLKTNDYILALKTEKKIWKIWSTHPSNDRKGFRLTDMLAQGDNLISEKEFSKAIDIFSLIISIICFSVNCRLSHHDLSFLLFVK